MLRSTILLLLIVPSTSLTQQIPKTGQVRVEGRFRDGPVPEDVAGFCDHAALLPSQFVRLYRAYHEKSPQVISGGHSYLLCGVRGTITAKGQLFTWKKYVGNVILTTYPDGREHFRAGRIDPQD